MNEPINRAIRQAGVVWHECGGCGIPWPFPKGDARERNWRCQNCVTADWARVQRQMAELNKPPSPDRI